NVGSRCCAMSGDGGRSTISAVLCGGPPWGFRIGHDTRERPVIARTIPGGRADLAGMQEGDVIQSVNSIPVLSAADAQSIVQEMEASGDLRMKINRFNNTPADIVISSVLDSPAPVRKEAGTNFSPRGSTSSGGNYSPHLPRSLRFEGNPQQRTQDKRRFFESLGGSPRAMRDPLLARKIQMGLADNQATPSENGTIASGYDSVFGDICGGNGSRMSSQASVRSDIPSSVNSVNGDEDLGDLTLSLDPENTPRAPSHLTNQFSPQVVPVSSPFSILFNPPPPPPFDDPDPSPVSVPSPRPEPVTYRPPSRGPDLSSSHLHFGYPAVPSEPTLPVYHRSLTPQLPPHSPPHNSHQPRASQIPVLQSYSRGQNGVAAGSNGLQQLHQAVFNPPPPPAETQLFTDEPTLNPMEPAGSSSSSQWHVRTTEPANVAPAHCEIEVPGRRSVAALREQIAVQLDVKSPDGMAAAKQYQRPKTPVKSWIKVHEPGDHSAALGFGRVLDGPPPADKFYQGVPPPSYNYVPHKQASSQPRSSHESSSTISDESRSETRAPSLVGVMRPAQEIERAELRVASNGFGNEIHTHSQQHPTVLVEARARSCTTPLPIRERPSIDRVSVERGVLQTADLESAELQRNHSASYSSLNSDHLGTIRRRPKPEDEVQMASLRTSDSGLASNCEHDSPSDSGYDASPESRKDSMLTVRDSPPPFSSDSREAFSSLPPTALTKIEIELPKRDDPPSQPHPEEPEHLNKADTASSPNYRRDDSDMGHWYRNMFKQLHKIEGGGDAPILKYRLDSDNIASHSRRPSSPSPSSISTTIEVDTRRAKSVGRDPLPSSSTAPPAAHPADNQRQNASALRGSTPVGRASATCNGHGAAHKTVHFHLPSYRFVDEDSRGIVTPAGRSCLRCGLPRKPDDDGLEKIYAAVNKEFKTTRQRRPNEDRTIAAARIADRLEATAVELEEFIASLDATWNRRSKSNPSITPSTSKEQRAKIADDTARKAIEKRHRRMQRLDLAEEIAALKAITNDEMATTMRAERLGEELDRERARRHGYQPNSVPSLATNTDRFTGLLNAYGSDDRGLSPARSTSSGTGVRTAVVLYRFVPQTERELPLNKGDIVRLRRDIDGNWVEGERNGRVGIFPASYVDIEECSDSVRQRLRAVYPFTGRNHNEMSLKMGDVLTFRRHIDENWTEGVNHIGEIGIFPSCYVRPIEEMHQDMSAVVPDRPKTPKLPSVSFVGNNGQEEHAVYPAYDRPADRMDRRSMEPQQQQQLPPPMQPLQPQQRHSQPAVIMPAQQPQLPLLQQQPQHNGSRDSFARDIEINLPHPLPETSASRTPQTREQRLADPHGLDESLEDLLRTLPTNASTPLMRNGHHSTAQRPEP
ncbi:hypothetical protein PFISCL1PPCAC_12839, partial [Pristionchus fissidentatus]